MTDNKSLKTRIKKRAPELAGAAGWLNVPRPLSLEDLRGKIVLLDFWTYCCINCMHVIPDLKRLEARYPQELVVIGVHSAKFTNEKESANIRDAVLRYGIEHPVVNDAGFAIWRRYGIRAWPTLVLVDPDGFIVGAVSGEGNYAVLESAIDVLIKEFGDRLNRQPLPIALEKDRAAATLLLYPGKVLADIETGRLFIADSNHHRVIVADISGKALAVAGCGSAGRDDGPFDKASFNNPQGMALDGAFLYVADADNHLLRRLDLAAGTVSTIAGTGVQGSSRSGGPALSTPLNSPWDLAVLKSSGDIYVAMAGAHQIWVYRSASAVIEPFAGSGQENIADGALAAASLAQPSGITTDGTDLYFADSEVSALRMIEMFGGRTVVRTLIGKGLFEFGDRDGPFDEALLQHPLGVTWDDGKLYVADTYNSKVKVADLAAKEIRTLAGGGAAWAHGSPAPSFSEPGGLSVGGAKLYVADTNNHAIKVVKLSDGSVSTLPIDLSAAQISASPEFDLAVDAERIDLSGRPIPASGEIVVAFELPVGMHLSAEATPLAQMRVTADDGRQFVTERWSPPVRENSIRLTVKAGGFESRATIETALVYYFCAEPMAACYLGSLLITGTLSPGSGTVELAYKIGH